MKIAGWFVAIAVGILILMGIWSLAGSLVTARDDMSVVVGILLYILMIAIIIIAITFAIKKVKKDSKKLKGGKDHEE